MQAHQRPEYNILQEDPRPMPDLPQELIVDILTRLPVKSILRFRCVSKSWLCLIASPHFIKSHLTISTKVNNHARHGLLLAPIDAPTELYTCSLYSVLYQRSPVSAEKVQLPLQSKYPRLSFVGCCNGLVCLSEGSHDLILFNPSTRKSNVLPNSGIDVGKFKHMTYGFGYDEVHDDYKVVAIGYSCPYGMNCQTIVNVYSLRTNSWRNIQGYEGGFISSCSGVFVNGALHWLVVSEDGSISSWRIVSLNLATETYGEILQPNYEKGNVSFTPGVLEGNLCVFYNHYEVKFDVWVMKEYGLKESWTKLACIPYSVNFKGRASPLFVSEAGEILLKHDYSLMLYNGKDDIFTNRDLQMQGANYPGAAAVYIEGLVSPHIDEVGHKTCAQ
ncbi:F-box/kelch-repeat protein At3g23880-like [Coffea arabica]|uniref:F-box/kelch-repeat protein At3g23880-like n=1 Tax=Coffea arabica TaxID=13443 RepID=A0A6P6WUG1_COFAR|nr:F-box/kelch-repeat protein At3g23880-like [Coffea arabica]